MTNSIELRQLHIDHLSTDDQYITAHRVQQLLWEDFVRLSGVNPEDLRTAVDPESDEKVSQQVEKILAAGQNDSVYAGVYRTDANEDESLQGIIKIGSWKRGDQKPFGYAVLNSLVHGADPLASPQRGLHAFAMSDSSREMTGETVNRLLDDPTDQILNRYSELRVAVDESDTELSLALVNRSAKIGRHGIISLAGYDRSYRLHKVAPRNS
ncbi:MAG: hypothetical protein ABIQ04_01695 [Candidatus Saccharimonadales bacterium]